MTDFLSDRFPGRNVPDAEMAALGAQDALAESVIETMERRARLPKPFYEEPGIQIFLGDCRDILPLLPKVDLVCTDPPYMGLQGGLSHHFSGVGKRINPTVTVGDPWAVRFDEWVSRAVALSSLGGFIFCSYHSVSELRVQIGPVESAYLLVWYKRNSSVAICNVPRFTSEFIWSYKTAPGLRWREIDNTVFDIPCPQGGCMAEERILDKHGRSAHPTQKPIALIHKLLAVGGQTILDPFMGSGTTLVAAKQLGRRTIGIEIEEKYCQIAVERLRQAVLPLEPAPEPEQLELTA